MKLRTSRLVASWACIAAGWIMMFKDYFWSSIACFLVGAIAALTMEREESND